MKTKINRKLLLIIPTALMIFFSLAFTLPGKQDKKKVNFTIRGNGKFNLELGIGSSVGNGACCRGVSSESYVGFSGEEGDVVWDAKTRKVIIKVYSDLEGKTVDLREYY